MDKIEKLFRRISNKDRLELLKIIDLIQEEHSASRAIQKVKGTDLYRIRKGRYRIIFHYENSEAIIDSIKLRNESTYKNL